MKKVCIFDFDGTIIDSMDEFADIASAVLNKYFGTPLDEARRQYINTSGLPFSEQVEILHPNNPRNTAAANEYESTKEKTYLSKKPFSDVKETIQHLCLKRIKTVVSSNNFQELVDKLIDKTEIKFDMVLGWKRGFAKGKDHFEHVRQKLRCNKNEMIFVGDSLKDAERAADYGIDFIGKAGTFTREDFAGHCEGNMKVVDSLKELSRTIAR